MFSSLLESLKSQGLECAYFDDYKINPSEFSIIPHEEDDCIEFDSYDECYGGQTIYINLKTCKRIKLVWKDNSTS